MVPTALGVKAAAFYAVLITAFFAAPYMNLFFLLLSFLTVVGVASVPWTRRNTFGIGGELLPIDPAPAGSRIPVTFALHSASRRPRFALQLFADVGGARMRWRDVGGARIEAARVSEMRGALRVDGELGPLARGLHPIRSAGVASTYPLGFWRVRRALHAPPALVVYPAPADLGDARTRAELLNELCGGAASADGEMGPSGLRQFRDGDALRDIHWRASARRGVLAVREWEGSALAGFEVCLDLRAEPAVLERALSAVTSLALWSREHKEAFALSSQDHRGTYGEGHRPWADLWRYLAGAQPLPAHAPPPAATSPAVLRLPAALAAVGGR
jgi:uncharacterized protein (DUF58 family)